MKKVVLIGDSIRGGYQPLVVTKLKGRADVWGPVENCRHSLWALDHFPEWVTEQKPDIVHVNFGIHDVSIQPDGEHQILLPQYRLCLKRFIEQVKGLGNAQMIWATTTPLFAGEEGVPMSQWKIDEAAELAVYSAAAREIVDAEGLAVNDLHATILENGHDKCLTEDGCHMTEFGNEVLAGAVVRAVEALL